jgi:hypothetical protein
MTAIRPTMTSRLVTRLLSRGDGSVCTNLYAITPKGALAWLIDPR